MRPSRLVALLITVSALAVFAHLLIHATLFAPESNIIPPLPEQSSNVSNDEYPMRLVIPALHLDANVQWVGVTKNGTMGIPSNFTDVAWYRYGTTPGYRGSAVIDGHVDNGLALPGVFKHLEDIKLGDDVYVQKKNNETLHYHVIEIENYPYKNVPTERIFNRNDSAYVNLITCGGEWVKSEKTYDHRLVVYTELVR